MRTSSLFTLPVQYSVTSCKRGCWQGNIVFFLFCRETLRKSSVMKCLNRFFFFRITDLMSAGKMFVGYSLGRVRNSAHRDTELMMLYNGIP